MTRILVGACIVLAALLALSLLTGTDDAEVERLKAATENALASRAYWLELAEARADSAAEARKAAQGARERAAAASRRAQAAEAREVALSDSLSSVLRVALPDTHHPALDALEASCERRVNACLEVVEEAQRAVEATRESEEASQAEAAALRETVREDSVAIRALQGTVEELERGDLELPFGIQLDVTCGLGGMAGVGFRGPDVALGFGCVVGR